MNVQNKQYLPTSYLDDFTEPPKVRVPLLFTRHGRWEFEDYISRVKSINPVTLIPPFFPRDSYKTSLAVERVRAALRQLDIQVGVTLVGQKDEQLAMSSWAFRQNYAPIVLPPDPGMARSRQAAYFHMHRGIHPTWYHLAGGLTQEEELGGYPWVYSYGDELEVVYE